MQSPPQIELASRLHRQLAKILQKITDDPALSSHRFFTVWREQNPQVRCAQLYEHCVAQANPYDIIAAIAEAAVATWKNAVSLPAGGGGGDDGVARDLCCSMSLVAFERAIREDPAGRLCLENGVPNVGMFVKEAAAITAAAWLGAGLRLQVKGAAKEQCLHVTNLISDHAEIQYGVKTLQDTIEDEIGYRAQQYLYPDSKTRRDLRPEFVRAGLERMERASGTRPIVGIGGAHGHTSLDEVLRQRLLERWGVDIFIYAKDRSDLRTDQKDSWRRLEQTMLEHFTQVMQLWIDPVASVTQQRCGNVFISYSRIDDPHRRDLVEHLTVLKTQGTIEIWDDQQIGAGEDARAEIDQRLQTCSVAVLLVSSAFLSSRFVLNEEIPKLLQRHSAGGMKLVPILVRDCAWERVPWLAPLQLRPGHNTALDTEKQKRDAQLAQISREIGDLCGWKARSGEQDA